MSHQCVQMQHCWFCYGVAQMYIVLYVFLTDSEHGILEQTFAQMGQVA